MPELFGLDIAKLVADGIASAGNVRSGTLTKRTPGTRTGGQLTGGTNPAEVAHTFRGFVDFRSRRRSGQVGTEQFAVLTILGDTISPAAVPDGGDRFTLDSFSGDITEILSADPAQAVYECLFE